MSDFSLLNFLNIKVPNEPSTPISQKKESFKILSPSVKPEESRSTPKSRKTPERSLEHTTSTDDNASTPKTGKLSSPFYRTTYAQSYAGTSGSSSDAREEEAAPLTPSSVQSASSTDTTISECPDPQCDDCLNRKDEAGKKTLAQYEKELERAEFQIVKRRLEEEIANEQRVEAEKKEKIKRDLAIDKERLRAEKADQRAQKQRENDEELAMQKQLLEVDNKAIEALHARNREYVTDLKTQIDDDRARRIAQTEQDKALPSGSPLSFGEEEEARQAARQASQKDILETLHRQVADRRAEGRAEKKAEDDEVKRRYKEDDAAYQAKTAAEREKDRLQKADILNSNREAVAEKKVREGEAHDVERAWTAAQAEQMRRDGEEQKRKADENKRAELEALHRQLADQVQRRRDALRQAREEDKAYLPREALLKKNVFIHCTNCEQDLPPTRFSNYVVTPNGKIYRKNKALPKDSPLHKYLNNYGRAEAQPMDLSHNYS